MEKKCEKRCEIVNRCEIANIEEFSIEKPMQNMYILVAPKQTDYMVKKKRKSNNKNKKFNKV